MKWLSKLSGEIVKADALLTCICRGHRVYLVFVCLLAIF